VGLLGALLAAVGTSLHALAGTALLAALLATTLFLGGLRGLPFLGFFACSMYLLSHLIELL
jgi:hypothetical protein